MYIGNSSCFFVSFAAVDDLVQRKMKIFWLICWRFVYQNLHTDHTSFFAKTLPTTWLSTSHFFGRSKQQATQASNDTKRALTYISMARNIYANIYQQWSLPIPGSHAVGSLMHSLLLSLDGDGTAVKVAHTTFHVLSWVLMKKACPCPTACSRTRPYFIFSIYYVFYQQM